MAAAFLSLALAACSGSAGTDPTPTDEPSPTDTATSPDEEPADSVEAAIAALYEAALEEGEVTYWGADDPPVVEAVMAAFQEQFPGIRVNPVLIQPEEAVERLITESASGQSPATDVLASSLIPSQPLMERDLAETVDWAALGVPEDQIFFDGRGVLVFNLSYSIAFNPSEISAEDVPNTVDGLIADEDLDGGRLAVESRGRVLAVVSQEIGEDATLAQVDGLLAKSPLVIRGAGPIGQAVSTGEAHVALALLTSSALEMMDAGANIDYVIPDPLPVTSLQNIVLKDAAHPNAAKLLALWQNSAAAMEAYAELGLFPERFSGEWIPEYSQAVLDAGVALVYETEENIEQMSQVGAAVGERLAGLQ